MKGSFAAVAFALLGLLGAASSQDDSAPTAPIAFVDLNQALNGCEKVRARKEDLKRSYAPQFEEFKRIKDDLERRQRELEALDPSTRAYHEARRDLAASALKFEEDQKYFLRETEREGDRILLDTYRDIRTAIAEIAKSRGLAAVLSVDEEGGAQGEEPAQSLQRIRRRSVHFYDSSLDLTAEVVRLLNR